MKILGISGFYHDSAAALIVDGEIVAAAQEERFNRKKHYAGFPTQAIAYCLKQGGIDAGSIDHVAFYDKPFLKFERLLETYLAFAPSGFKSFRTAMPLWLKEKLFQKSLIKQQLKKFGPEFNWDEKLLFIEHHLSHAASAFYPSPFEEAAILTLDGVGEWATTSLSIGKGSQIQIAKELHFPHSLGLLYSAFTYYCGFKVNSGEYKLMGLAPYGKPIYKDVILEHLIDLKEDGSFRLDQKYFNYCTGLEMTSEKFHQLFDGPPRKASDLLTAKHMDLAASVQAVTEEVVLRLSRNIAKETGLKNLCLAGGVALNCVANGKILRDSQFENIWIQPAAGDAGGAIGAAFAAYHLHCAQPRVVGTGDKMQGAYLGPEYTDEQIEKALTASGAVFDRLDYDEMIAQTAKALAEDKAVGWFQGRMEFGPRALGGRSILGDARSDKMQKNLNLKVKFRESFRPFAPSVLASDANEWFELEGESPYMLIVSDVKSDRRRELPAGAEDLFGIEKLNIPRSQIPAVTHVDYSARIQTVHESTNRSYHDLLSAFKSLTGCPVVVNTSFNVRGEPIVCTPEDAFRCFMGTDIDTLVVGNFVMQKASQKAALKIDYKDNFELD